MIALLFATFAAAATNFTVNLTDENNIFWSMPLQFGTPMQGSTTSKFLLNTGAMFTTVTKNTCSTCTEKYYNEAASTTKVSGAGAWNISTIMLPPTLLLEGSTSSDNMCINPDMPNTCVENFGFFQVGESNDLDNNFKSLPTYAGSLGLAPLNSQNGPTYVYALKEAGFISEAIASFQLNFNVTKDTKSIVKFGPFDESDYNGTLSSHYVTNDEDWWWSLNWTGMVINVNNTGYIHPTPKGSLTTIWSAWPFIQMPEKAYNEFVKMLVPFVNDTDLDCDS
jgi:hypothetical protein